MYLSFVPIKKNKFPNYKKNINTFLYTAERYFTNIFFGFTKMADRSPGVFYQNGSVSRINRERKNPSDNIMESNYHRDEDETTIGLSK